jgi:hypothetical protein
VWVPSKSWEASRTGTPPPADAGNTGSVTPQGSPKQDSKRAATRPSRGLRQKKKIKCEEEFDAGSGGDEWRENDDNDVYHKSDGEEALQKEGRKNHAIKKEVKEEIVADMRDESAEAQEPVEKTTPSAGIKEEMDREKK